MIRCPKCGKMNQDSSRFCNECGATLPQTRIRCPKCGMMNPIGNVLCSRCNTRLLPLDMKFPEQPRPAGGASTGVKGLSLPTLPTKGDAPEATELPDWLFESPAETSASPQAATPSASTLPDWLSDMLPEVPDSDVEMPETAAEPATPAELPPWFSDLLEEVPSSPGEPVVTAGPTGAATAPPVTELPDWFADLTSETPKAVMPTVGEAPAAAAFAQEEGPELPDWLRAIADMPQAGIPQEPAPLPDWLLANADASASFAEPTAQELPDWLLRGAENIPTLSAQPPLRQPAPFTTEPPPMATSDWLSGILPEEAAPEVAAPAETLPDWLSGVLPEEAAPEAAAPAETLPDWLSGILPEEAAPEAAAPAETLPDWLSGVLPEEAAPEAAAPAETLPDWLSGILPEEAAPEAAAPAATLPDWLSGILPEEAAPEAAAPAATLPDWLSGILPEEAAPEAAAPAATLPDWLSGVLPEEAAPEAAAPAATLPDWLSGILPEEAAPEAAAPAATLPDWLSGILPEEAAPEAAAPAATLPDWLSGILPEEAAPEAAAPDRLAGIFIGEEGPLPSSPLPKAAEPKEPLPDWLSEISAGETEATIPKISPIVEEETPGGPGVFELEEEIATPFAQQPTAPSAPIIEETPAWLADLGTVESVPPAPRTATPGWLKDVTPPEAVVGPASAPAVVLDESTMGGAPEAVESVLLDVEEIPAVLPEKTEAVPDWLKDLAPAGAGQPLTEEGIVQSEEMLARAEVPAWLESLRPPGTGPLPSLPEAAGIAAEVFPEGGPLARAEIPDWVQELRPTAPTGRVVEKPFPDTIEAEGPLAGIVGVLPAEPWVDMPADFKPTPTMSLPESIIAQAQLWQQLLERPRSIQRPVAQQRGRAGEGEMATRWLIALALIAATLFGLLAGNTRLSQALSKPPIENLSRTIQALTPEDTVIVAIEYGPAEAGEMTPLATALIEHLQSRDVHLTLVSTLPEGVGLAQGLLATSNQATPATYLPGSSSGVAIFLRNELPEARLLVVLAGRTERLRWWVEQNNASRTRALPMVIGVSAAVGPQASPYLETSTVKGWLIGFPDVVAYREFRNTQSGVLNSQLNALMLSHWAAAGLLFLGLFYYLARGRRGGA